MAKEINKLSNKSITSLSAKVLKGKRVLLRLDLNVPLSQDEIEDTFRIDSTLPTVEFLKARGAKVIIISHLGEGEESLAPVAKYLNKKVGAGFYSGLDAASYVEQMKEGDVVLLENLRSDPGEIANDQNFAKQLALLADLYVNDAFSVCHREHASIVSVPKFLPSYFGLQIEKEYENLSKAFDPKHPFLFILGGIKFKTKIPLVKKFIELADHLFIGGALANTFFKRLGYNLGSSIAEDDLPGIATLLKSKKIMLPTDLVVDNKGEAFVKRPDDIKKGDVISDVGPDSITNLLPYIEQAKFILWNGPLGNFEKGYNKATLNLARAIADSSAFSILGGGDTIAAIADLHLENKFGFISTGGGAMLDFLVCGTLPGIEAVLKNRKKLK